MRIKSCKFNKIQIVYFFNDISIYWKIIFNLEHPLA